MNNLSNTQSHPVNPYDKELATVLQQRQNVNKNKSEENTDVKVQESIEKWRPFWNDNTNETSSSFIAQPPKKESGKTSVWQKVSNAVKSFFSAIGNFLSNLCGCGSKISESDLQISSPSNVQLVSSGTPNSGKKEDSTKDEVASNETPKPLTFGDVYKEIIAKQNKEADDHENDNPSLKRASISSEDYYRELEEDADHFLNNSNN